MKRCLCGGLLDAHDVKTERRDGVLWFSCPRMSHATWLRGTGAATRTVWYRVND